MAESSTRYLQEMGPNLIKIMKRLLANQNLLRLLIYTDKDPLSKDKPDLTQEQAYQQGDNGSIRIIPIIGTKEHSSSIITLRVLKGIPSTGNS